jgi:hypothetical protein
VYCLFVEYVEESSMLMSYVKAMKIVFYVTGARMAWM